MNETGIRAFMRREDYAPQKANNDSPFREFDVKCLTCRSVKLKLKLEFDEEKN